MLIAANLSIPVPRKELIAVLIAVALRFHQNVATCPPVSLEAVFVKMIANVRVILNAVSTIAMSFIPMLQLMLIAVLIVMALP